MEKKPVITTDSRKKIIYLSMEVYEMTEDERATLASIKAACPDYKTVLKKAVGKKQQIKKAEIMKYVDEYGTEEQKKDYQSFKGTFFALRKKFLSDFPHYSK